MDGGEIMIGCMPTPEEARRMMRNGTAMRIDDFDKFIDQMAEAFEESERTGEDQSAIHNRLIAADPSAFSEITYYDSNGDPIKSVEITKEVTPEAQAVLDILKNLPKNSK
jgi:hypothetical protein